jgi:hypothetical protein
MFLQSTINESPWQVKNAAEAGQNSKQDHDDARSDSLYHVMLVGCYQIMLAHNNKPENHRSKKSQLEEFQSA